MPVLQRMAERRATAINPIHPRDPALAELFGLGLESKAGQPVTAKTARRQPTFLAAGRYIVETVASLPLIMYERTGPESRNRAQDHPLYWRLHDQPNRSQTTFEWLEMSLWHVMDEGALCSRIVSSRDLQPFVLMPLHPSRLTPFFAPDGSVAHEYRRATPNARGQMTEILLADEVLYMPFMSPDGLRGTPIRELLQEAIGLALAEEEYGARVFKDGERPGGYLKRPAGAPKLSDEAFKRLRESWRERTRNPHGTPIAEEGMEYAETGFTPEDTQLVDARKYQGSDIGRGMRVPPPMYGDYDRATFSNVEHAGIDAVTNTIRPWLVRLEQRMKMSLLDEDERRRFFFEFLVEGLLRGDATSEAQALSTMRQNGIINADEWRAKKNMNPLPDGQGQTYLVPLNMIPAESVGDDAGQDGGSGGIPSTTGSPGSRARRERRSRTSLGLRRLRRAYEPAFADAARRVLRAEGSDVLRQFRRMAGDRSLADFATWLEGFYQEHRAMVEQRMRPVVAAYIEAVAEMAAAALAGAAADEIDLSPFAGAYAGAYGVRHVGFSQAAIRALIEQADPDELAPRMVELLEGWPDARALEVAAAEVVQAGNAAARETWRESGVRELVWVASGGECPLCDKLDGQVVGIEREFVFDGEDVTGGDRTPLTARKTLHPPLHRGCVCSIEPA
jgi:HK97 family phage portal protein